MHAVDKRDWYNIQVSICALYMYMVTSVVRLHTLLYMYTRSSKTQPRCVYHSLHYSAITLNDPCSSYK